MDPVPWLLVPDPDICDQEKYRDSSSCEEPEAGLKEVFVSSGSRSSKRSPAQTFHTSAPEDFGVSWAAAALGDACIAARRQEKKGPRMNLPVVASPS